VGDSEDAAELLYAVLDSGVVPLFFENNRVGAAAMKDAKSWLSRAEQYCRDRGVEKVVHPSKKYL
jgi:hypothetical protein